MSRAARRLRAVDAGAVSPGVGAPVDRERGPATRSLVAGSSRHSASRGAARPSPANSDGALREVARVGAERRDAVRSDSAQGHASSARPDPIGQRVVGASAANGLVATRAPDRSRILQLGRGSLERLSLRVHPCGEGDCGCGAEGSAGGASGAAPEREPRR